MNLHFLQCLFSLGTADITKELLGDWNNPFPIDITDIYNIILISEDLSFKVDINSNPKLVITSPMKVNISEPILSDKYPLIGATTHTIIG